jgi:hypothetical protein
MTTTSNPTPGNPGHISLKPSAVHCALPVWRVGVVRRPDDSLEVVNVAGDSAVGRGRIQ